MKNKEFVFEEAISVFLDNYVNMVPEANTGKKHVNMIDEFKINNCLFAACLISHGADWFLKLVNRIVNDIDKSSCLVNVDKSNMDEVCSAIMGAGFTLNQANVYIERKYGVSREYTVLGFVKDSLNGKEHMDQFYIDEGGRKL